MRCRSLSRALARPANEASSNTNRQRAAVGRRRRRSRSTKRLRPPFLPRLREFKPDILIHLGRISTRTRATRSLISISLRPDYSWVTKKLMEIADASAKGRVVSLLEERLRFAGSCRDRSPPTSLRLMHG